MQCFFIECLPSVDETFQAMGEFRMSVMEQQKALHLDETWKTLFPILDRETEAPEEQNFGTEMWICCKQLTIKQQMRLIHNVNSKCDFK